MPKSKRHLWVVLLVSIVSLAVYSARRFDLPVEQQTGTPQATSGLQRQFEQVLAAHRKIIVLLAREDSLSDKEKNLVNQDGQAIFHENLLTIDKIDEELEKLVASNAANRFEGLGALLDYVESGPGLFDADRLAFRELLASMQKTIAKDGSLPAIRLHKRIADDMEALNEIERIYDKEISQIFDRFDRRGIVLKRERWEDYLAHLETIYSREQILKEYGTIIPYAEPRPNSEEALEEKKSVIHGTELPPKTLVLTFDDGPHPTYTQEIEAILKQYGVPGVFFNVGRNLGSILPDGKPQVSARGLISRQLMQDGFTLGNHSFTHAQLSKESGDALRAEIDNTDVLLKSVNADRAPLFRFPYGATSKEGENLLREAGLKSVLWNIDSLDWADPVPSSITDRVLREVDKEGRGIILFHDIHERAVKALPAILDQLVAQGYQFAGWDGKAFRVVKATGSASERTPITSGYAESWAVVIGIDKYARWPQLHYAASDAQAIRQMLIERFGFPGDHVFSLLDGDATRTGILSVFHDKLAHGVGKDDRIFVFFAGHGTTRKLSSGRELGYIVPADSDPDRFDTDAIPMTEVQDIAESLEAKHVLFIMDACYSGLGLTRGMMASSYLKENARRIGRQMLTAGGADQLVADGGPNGHSIFTWTLLQGLDGKADLNNDGLITATELAAYMAPAVSSISSQTPAFGSLPGSQGGEFIFELAGKNEFINEQTAQLNSDAIALNDKLDSAAITQSDSGKTPTTPVVVKDLQGGEQKIAPPVPAIISVKQMAQLANDRGLQRYREKKYTEAEAEFTEALKLRPDFALAANNLGFVFYKQGKAREAILWFENTIKIDPSRAIAYVNLGDAYLMSNAPDKAKDAYETYLRLVPNGVSASYVKSKLDAL